MTRLMKIGPLRVHEGGAPWQAGLVLGRMGVGLTKWDSAAGYGRRFGPLHVWHRRGKAQLFVTLRRARYGRTNGRSAMYLRLSWR